MLYKLAPLLFGASRGHCTPSEATNQWMKESIVDTDSAGQQAHMNFYENIAEVIKEGLVFDWFTVYMQSKQKELWSLMAVILNHL